MEAKFHKILTNLAHARIRKGREFFNITLEEAFEHLCDIANLIDDSEIKIYPQKIIKEKDEENYNNTNIDNKTTRSLLKSK